MESKKGIMDSHLIRIRCNSNLIPDLVSLLINDSDYIFTQLKLESKGAIMEGLNSSIIKSLSTLLPSLFEQERILNYLDHKTHQIDTLIENKQKQVEILKEQRTAIINQAVTKGLNPDVKMKDSGIEWIGKIPMDWDAVLFKRIYKKIKDGTHGTFERVTDGKPLLSAKNVSTGGIRITDEESLISVEDFHEIVKNGFPQKNDLLLTIVGTIGRTFVYDKDYPLAFQRSVLFIRLKKDVNPYFYYYLFQTSLFLDSLVSLAKTSAQSGVYMKDISDLIVLKLPEKEQKSIAKYLDHKTQQIDIQIEKKQKQVELIQEYRTTLISEAVTGKIDVRGEVIA